ncbi:MAG: 1,4-dihydroxy-2-naphthoate octaprenyltransferase [Parachlamydiales bacterium]|jgi:1,4-dihydroxy-2-naphthoate octaprenyltransferase
MNHADIKAERPSQILVWFYAARPKTLTAGVLPVVAASALAYYQFHAWSWLVFFCGLLTALCIQIGVNFTNDAFDYKKGADNAKRIGFDRVVQKGWISYSQMLWAGIAALTAGVLFALPIAWDIPSIGVIVAMSALLSYFYTGGPFPLAYNGLGELFVLLFYGWAITGAVYFAMTGVLDLSILILGLQIGLLSTAILANNNFRDYIQDKAVHKNTLIVRWGINFGRWEIISALLLPFVLNIYWFEIGMTLPATLSFLAFPMALQVVREIWDAQPSARGNVLLVKSAATHLVFSLFFSIGCFLS